MFNSQGCCRGSNLNTQGDDIKTVSMVNTRKNETMSHLPSSFKQHLNICSMDTPLLTGPRTGLQAVGLGSSLEEAVRQSPRPRTTKAWAKKPGWAAPLKPNADPHRFHRPLWQTSMGLACIFCYSYLLWCTMWMIVNILSVDRTICLFGPSTEAPRTVEGAV